MERGIGQCIRSVKTTFRESQIPGEIIALDSSTDRASEIARAMGAQVLNPDGQGSGYAYKCAFERTRSDIIAMGDADTT
jgi:glycosyltransferase involved in cell wall biosynthesis